MSSRRSLSRILVLPLLGVLSACKATTAAPAASKLILVQGNLQQAAVGTLLPTPIVLRVLAVDGKPMPQIPVSFAIAAGGGTVDPATSVSDANGEVKAKWTLGIGAVQTLTGTAPGVDPLTIQATGIVPTDLIIAQGNLQTAKAGTLLPVSVVIRVTGGQSVPIPNQTVTMSVTAGGGSLSPSTAVTNAQGEATVKWTLGPSLGLQTVSITAGTLGPITLSAVAN